MLKVPSSDKPGQVVFAMDRLLYSRNGCGDRAGKRGVDGSDPSAGVFLAHQGTSPLAGHKKILIADSHKDEINHWLRDAWRGHRSPPLVHC